MNIGRQMGYVPRVQVSGVEISGLVWRWECADALFIMSGLLISEAYKVLASALLPMTTTDAGLKR